MLFRTTWLEFSRILLRIDTSSNLHAQTAWNYWGFSMRFVGSIPPPFFPEYICMWSDRFIGTYWLYMDILRNAFTFELRIMPQFHRAYYIRTIGTVMQYNKLARYPTDDRHLANMFSNVYNYGTIIDPPPQCDKTLKTYPRLIIEYRMWPVLTVPDLVPACQRRWKRWCGVCLVHLDKDRASKSFNQLRPDPCQWEKMCSPLDAHHGMVFFWCDHL